MENGGFPGAMFSGGAGTGGRGREGRRYGTAEVVGTAAEDQIGTVSGPRGVSSAPAHTEGFNVISDRLRWHHRWSRQGEGPPKYESGGPCQAKEFSQPGDNSKP